MSNQTILQHIQGNDNKIEIHYQDGDVVLGNVMTQDNMFISHNDNMSKIIIVQEGCIQFLLNGHQHRLEQDDIIYIGPRSYTEDLLATPGAKVHYIGIRAGIMTSFFQAPAFLDLAFAIYQNPVLHIGSEDKQLMIDMALLLNNIIHKNYPFERQIVTKFLEAYIYILLGIYQQKLGDSLPKQQDTKISSMETIFRKFMGLLSRQEVKPRNVKYYSDQLNITTKYLSACCQKVSGLSCFAHINRAVLNDIEMYLRQPEISYKEIAYKLGFPNHSFFSKYVREHLGLTPTQYRNKYLKDLAQRSGYNDFEGGQ